MGQSRVGHGLGTRRTRPGAKRYGLSAAVVAMVIGALAPLAASGTPATDGNPNLAPSCGSDVTLVIDDSASINSTEAAQMRTAASAFSAALVGTPSRLKVVTFDSRAQGVDSAGSLTSTLGSIVFRDPALYTAATSGSGQGGTNWDDGLEVARRSSDGGGDLLVFLTDGNPTYRNTNAPDGHADNGGHGLSGSGSSVAAANVSAAAAESTLMKAAGTHVFGIGIGLTDAASEQRLNDVTGDEELTLDSNGDPNIPFGQADYTIAPNFDDLEDIVEAFVRDLCAPSLNVTKYLQRANGTTERAGANEPWQFTAAVSPTPDSWQAPAGASGASASETTNANGASFKWEQVPVAPSSVDLSETAQAGWVYNGSRCTRNPLNGQQPTVIFDNVGTNAVGSFGDPSELNNLAIGVDEAVSCEVHNRQIRQSTIQVAKQTVPAGLSDTFNFTMSGGQGQIDTANGIGHGQTDTFTPVAPGTYTVTEAAASGYNLTSSTCDNLGTQATETSSPVDLVVGEGQNWRCTFVNTAEPGTIKVVKNTLGAEGAFLFTSDVPGLTAFSLATNQWTAATQAVTVPVGTYAIGEANPAPWQLTGSTCTGQQSPGSVFVGPGKNVVCTFTNTAPDPSITVTKSAGVASVAEPSGSVTYTVGVTNTSVEPVTITTLTDSIENGPALDITTTGAPITATTCNTLVGTVLAPTGATSTASCTFTATVTGNGGDTVGDEVTVTAIDDQQTSASDKDDASVALTNVAPTLSVSKTPSVSSIAEPGGSVTYTTKITNTGAEPVTLDTITDAIEGGTAFDVTTVAAPLTATTCDTLIGSSVAAGADVSCTFTIAHIVDRADVLPDGDLDDIVTVTGRDDDGQVTATAVAEVAVTDVKPTIEVTKTATPTSVPETAPGQTRPVSYLVTIQNTSVETVTIGSITDSVEGAPASPVTGTCAALIGTTLAAQTGTSCQFSSDLSGNAGDTIGDVVTVTASDDDGNDVEASDNATVAFTGQASSLAVTKTGAPASVPEPGGPVTYTLNITNTSPADTITIGSVTDSVEGAPAVAVGGTCAGLIGTSLAPGGVTTCTFTMTVTGNAGDAIGDTATVAGTDDDGDPVSASGDEVVTITDLGSSLQVTKVADVDSVPEPGGNVAYTVTITNTSVADAITLDTITDVVGTNAPVNAGGTCPALIGTTLEPAASTTCTFTLAVTGNAGDQIPDTVTVTGTDDDQQPVSDTGSEIVDISGLDSALKVTKVADVDSVPEPGGNVAYTVTITNTSVADAITLDTITDVVGTNAPVNAGGTCPALIGTTLEPAASTTCTFTLAVTGNAGDQIPDTVTVTGTDDDQQPVSDTGSEIVDISDVLPTGVTTKAASPSSVPEPGGPVTFTVAVTNTSTAEPATVTAISDDIDGTSVDVTTVAGPVTATTCATGAVLAPGATYSCSFTLIISGANAGATVVDTIAITLTDDESNTTTPTDTETVTVTDTLPTITVTKDNGGASVPAPGGPVEFNVSVTNTSVAEPVTLTSLTDTVAGGTPFDITVTDAPVLATTCATGGIIAPGASYGCSFTIEVTSDEAAVESDVVDAIAVDDEANPATGGDDEVTTITASADLSIDKRLPDGTLTIGEEGSYELEVTNNGPSTAANLVVTDTLPSGMTAISASGDGWACTIGDGEVTCQRPSLASGESALIVLVVMADGTMADTEAINVGVVEAETPDPDESNNRDETSDPVVLAENQDQDPPATPTTPTTPAAQAAPTNQTPRTTTQSSLARTGSDLGTLVWLGLSLVGIGLVTMRGRRTGKGETA